MIMTPTSAKMALDADRKPDILIHDPQTLSRDPDRLCDLQRIIVHKNDICRLDGCIGSHSAHGDPDIRT